MQEFERISYVYDREYYPWEYDSRAAEYLRVKPSFYTTEEDCVWLQKQAKIWQDRAEFIRQYWAKQEAAKKQATEQAKKQAELQASLQIIQEAKQAAEQQATLRANQRIKLQKKKRNEKTRLQYKRRSLQATVEVSAKQSIATEQDAESTQEKPGHGQVICMASFSTISATSPWRLRHHEAQRVKNTTRFWPTCLHAIQWHAFFKMTKQEEDLLERSQPNHEGFWPITLLES